MARPIRVAFVIGSLNLGGTETQLVELMRHIDRKLFEPVLFCLNEGGALEPDVKAMGVPYHIIGYGGIGGGFRKNVQALGTLFKFYILLWRYRPVIVHAFLYWANIIGAVLGRLALVPIIITSRRSMGIYKETQPILQRIEDFVNSFTDLVTVNSQKVWDDVLQREQIDPAIMRLIYNGVDSSKPTTRDRSEVRATLGLSGDTLVITCVANLHSYKGHRDLLHACARWKAEYAGPTALVCVGRDRGELEGLKALALDLDLCSKEVLFLGRRSDVRDLLNASDIAILPSHQEGFSNAVLEGMAVGLPQVVTNVGGNAEAVEDGSCGFVVPARDPSALAEAVLRLLKDSDLRMTMGQHARQRAHEKFTILAMTREVQSVYELLLTRKCPRIARTVFEQ